MWSVPLIDASGVTGLRQLALCAQRHAGDPVGAA
jgi:hypothetical protein